MNCENFFVVLLSGRQGGENLGQKITLKTFCHNGGKGVSFEIGQNAEFRVHSQFVAKCCEFQL